MKKNVGSDAVATRGEQSVDVRNGDSSVATAPRRAFRPLADVVESDDAYMVTAEMPGVDQESVDVSLERNVLTLTGRPRIEAHAGYEPWREEFTIGDYERSFRIADEIDADGIEAVMKNGVLRVRLPKARPSRRRIEIRSE